VPKEFWSDGAFECRKRTAALQRASRMSTAAEN
jgi:hypothetical protein